MNEQITYWAIVPAAGIGKRFGDNKPKQYLELCGKPIIAHTLSCLITHPLIHKTVVVLKNNDVHWPAIQSTFPSTKIITTNGGAERHHSVYQGLLALEKMAKENDWILVHDAVRPCLSHAAINRLIDALQHHSVGGLLGIRVRDTLKHTDAKGNVLSTLDRTEIWHAQTPQMFRYGLLCDALKIAIQNNQHVTDEAHAVELIGKKPRIIEGDADNIKITYAEDLKSAEGYVNNLILPDVVPALDVIPAKAGMTPFETTH